MIFILSLFVAVSSAEEVKAAQTEESYEDTIAIEERNSDEVLPSYTQIDNPVEKAIPFSWGTVYYSSVTKDDDHDHSGELQTTLKLRYVCKGGKKSKPERYSFCGYAKSEVDVKERAHLLYEMKKAPQYKGMTDAELAAAYDQKHNMRIVDPVKNISDVSTDGKPSSVDVTVLQKEGLLGSCEKKVTTLTLPVNCQ